MKRFIGFVIKEFYHIFRDPRTMLVLFGMPFIQMLLFGFVLTNEIRDVKIAVYDKSNDEITRRIVDKLTSSGYFILDHMIYSDQQIKETFQKGDVKEVVVFQDNFGRDLERNNVASVQLLADASDANMANLIVNYTTAIIGDFNQKLVISSNLPMTVDVRPRMVYNEQLLGVYMFVPGIMAMILMLISALMTSVSIVREKETGTMEVLLVSPLRPAQIIIGKVTPYVLLSFINAIVIILLGNYVFGLPVRGSTVLLLLESILFIVMALSLGIFISTVTSNQQTAMMISMFALMLPTILLSGFIFPIENMPRILQWLCQLMPPKWFIIIIKNIMIKGTGLAYIWKETLVLTGMTIFFIGLSIKKFSIRLE